MKALILSILVLASVSCFAQSSKSKDELHKEYLIRAKETPEYEQAFSDVNKVKENVKLANKRLLKATDVVTDYNSRLGEAMGFKKTLKEVESRINTAGNEFIKYVLLRSAARLAREDAAKLAN